MNMDPSPPARLTHARIRSRVVPGSRWSSVEISEAVSSHVTGAVLCLQNPDRPCVNGYKRVKNELLFNSGGLSEEQPRLTAARPFPFSVPHKLDFLLLLPFYCALSFLAALCVQFYL